VADTNSSPICETMKGLRKSQEPTAQARRPTSQSVPAACRRNIRRFVSLSPTFQTSASARRCSHCRSVITAAARRRRRRQTGERPHRCYSPWPCSSTEYLLPVVYEVTLNLKSYLKIIVCSPIYSREMPAAYFFFVLSFYKQKAICLRSNKVDTREYVHMFILPANMSRK